MDILRRLGRSHFCPHFMASLFKRSGSPYWFAAFDIPQPDGSARRLKKSTKKTKRSEAMAEAIRLEEIERKGMVSHPEAASKSYVVLSEAAEAAAKGELSEARARELLAKIAEISTGVPLRSYTVRSWSTDWLESKKASGKLRSFRRYKGSIDAFLAWLAGRADGRLESITKGEIRAFRDFILTGEGIPRTAKTSNFYAADVASMFRAAVREGLLLASPAAALEKLPEDDSTEKETFTLAEVSSLVEAAGGEEWQRGIFRPRVPDPELTAQRSADWQGMILVGFYTGARLGDCAALTWENVDMEARVIRFMPAKTSRKKKRLEVPIHERLFSYLDGKAGATERTGPLFPSLHGRSVAGKLGLSGHFKEITASARIDAKTVRPSQKDKKGRVVRRSVQAKTFHSLRHSLTSNLANADVSEEIRRRIVGHESADVHAKYTHTERETLARAVDKLPRV